MKPVFKKITAVTAVVILIVGIAVGVSVYNSKLLKSISINETELHMIIGDNALLVAALMPEEPLNPEITWKSADESVVTVSQSGKIVATGRGITEITCSSSENSEISASCKISVIEAAPAVSAANAAIYNIDTGSILMAKNTEEKIAPASLTKIITACVALKYVDADKVFTVGTELSLMKPHSSICQIAPGHKLELETLIKGMMVSSGNDAAYTIAANVAREESGNSGMSDADAVEHFCNLMNDFAKEIGMKNSNFTSPDGWDESMQYTTAEDLITATKYAMNNEIIKKIVATPSEHVTFASGEHINWTNTNQMLNSSSPYYNENVTGFKTGSTSGAGKCLVSTYESDNGNFIIVVTGCLSDEGRYTDTQTLIDWAIRNKHG